jgi:hypothetical protein
MIDKVMSNNQIVQHDRILRSLRLKRHWTNARIIVVISLIEGIIFIALGSIANYTYRGSGNTIFGLTNIGFIVLWLLLFSPLMWGAYLWQAQTAPEIFNSLAQNGVFDTAPVGDNTQQTLVKANVLLDRLNHPAIGIVTLLILATFWFNEIIYTWPEQFKIQQEFWYEVKWYLPLHVLAFTIGLYALFVFVIRQIIFILGLSKIFQNTEVQVKPFHSDNLGGFGIVGDYVKSSLLFIIGFGIIASTFALQFLIIGQSILTRTDVFLFFGIYLILAPLSLFVPIFSVRSSMLRARARELAPVAEEFQKTLDLMNEKMHEGAKEIKSINEKLDQLQQYRDRIIKVYPTMPVSLATLQGFSITATIPLVSGTVSLALQLLKP